MAQGVRGDVQVDSGTVDRGVPDVAPEPVTRDVPVGVDQA
jgi:hypothetical protein